MRYAKVCAQTLIVESPFTDRKSKVRNYVEAIQLTNHINP